MGSHLARSLREQPFASGGQGRLHRASRRGARLDPRPRHLGDAAGAGGLVQRRPQRRGGERRAGDRRPDAPGPAGQTQVRVPTQTAEGSLLPLPRLSTGPAMATGAAAAAAAAPPATAARREASFAAHAAALVPVGRGRGLRLLDVSTNKDLLGVELGAAASAGLPTADSSFQLFALDVCTPAANLAVFTLPQVQWEPVRTLDRDQDLAHLGSFPTPLASVTDGGATQLAVRSVRLVPAIPDLVVDVLIEEFGAGMPTGMVTTLPFGLRAALALRSAERRPRRRHHRAQPAQLPRP